MNGLAQNLRRYLRKDFATNLKVSPTGVGLHSPCISHCLQHAFGNCHLDHPKICENRNNLFVFFDKLKANLDDDDDELHKSLIEHQNQLIYFMAHHAQKTYLNAQLNVELAQLDVDGALFIVDYKMRILPQSARETKPEFFGKRGWTLHSVLIYTKNAETNNLNIQVFDHWSGDTKQDAWFTAFSLHAVLETLDKMPKWIVIVSDNGPHYHNTELMIILKKWKEWYDVSVRKWLFLEAGEAKTLIDSHHAQITHAIKRYVKFGHDINSGEDIEEAIKDIAGTHVAHLEPNRNQRNNDAALGTIVGIQNWHEWSWPDNENESGYICSRSLPRIGPWKKFTLKLYKKLSKNVS